MTSSEILVSLVVAKKSETDDSFMVETTFTADLTGRNEARKYIQSQKEVWGDIEYAEVRAFDVSDILAELGYVGWATKQKTAHQRRGVRLS